MEDTPQSRLVHWLMALATEGRAGSPLAACEAFMLAQKIALRISGKPVWHRDWARLRMNG